ncbi:shikimate/quinate 5-dehydrogenase [Klebsiella pneumoniae]|uniref:Shikimate/quinate 5-dehydrogenase n=1 Tax=Klebsiella pneumoniae TaxID=573 RepID=A0A377ZII3_KLEPN|nr:shikimate/quinate 5-dehydrogenase [Klebsiella pneumoniae]
MQLSALPDTLYGLDLLVNGSPAGMAGFDELPLPQALLDTLDSTTHVADVVTAPVMTPLLTFAAARGCKVQTGPEMALAQMRLMGQFIGAIPQEQGAAA